jgi:hypothetical protein
MAITVHVRLCVLGLLVATALACQDAPTNPTTIGRPQGLALAGTWTGLIGVVAQSSSALSATWTVSHTGNNVAGPITLVNSGTNVTFAGTLSGTLSGTSLPVTYTIPRGNVPNFPDCAMSGTGTLQASDSLMSGTLTIIYTNCQNFTSETSSTDTVQLTKQ